ncbi:hypothetical protein MGMO_45c00530 [Methyloglobulus morosus KoM1]|uniref:DUF262 domain-containing protein n=1 Tax=Methyloglobulus morosus KoM1 TaxID=1116472 RepID=V5DZU1_9GAMM|nr:DUF262 domain-containing protein [Methyloglobulus morosus]ESS72821.1 hypothetical protein MGMO_45c00530 [Methyloglobulus morosus KoM1]
MQAQNLTELFSNRFFKIPDYQRGYAWSEKQLSELWEDLNEIQEENGVFKHHYAGAIFLEKINTPENEFWITGSGFFNIVDGQQRLTTVYIALYELITMDDEGYQESSKEQLIRDYLYRKNKSGESKAYKIDYEITSKNREYLHNKIFNDNNVILDNKENLYTNNLWFSKSFFREKFSSTNKINREILFRKITEALLFDIRNIEKDLDVQVVFETMNNRGKPLTVLEKLKNRLIYLGEKLDSPIEDKKKLRDNINKSWGIIYSSLAENKDKVLDEDEFLSAHLSLYRKPEEYVFSEKKAEEKVFQMFCNKASEYGEEEVSYNKINDYILDLAVAAPNWFKVNNTEENSIKKILILNSTKEIKIFLLSLLKDDEIEHKSIFEKVEKILFKNKLPGINILDERVFSNWARDLYEKNNDKKEKLFADINKYVDTPISSDSFIIAIQNMYTYERGNKGFHRWVYLKYFLFEYENYLKLKYLEINDNVKLDDYDSTTIEHIIPQEWSLNWRGIVDPLIIQADQNYKDQLSKVLLNTLGNLTILKDGKNSSLGNKSWQIKKERFSVGSYNEIDISKNLNWSKNEIFCRGTEMLNFLIKKVDCLKLSDDQKDKILYFDDYFIDKLKP